MRFQLRSSIRAMAISLGFRALLALLSLLFCRSSFVYCSNSKFRLEDLLLSALAGGLPHEFGRSGIAEVDRFIASRGTLSKKIPHYYLKIANSKHAQSFRVASHHPSADDEIVSLIAGVSCVYRAEGVGAPIIFSLTDSKLKEKVDGHLGSRGAEAGNEQSVTSQCMTGQIALPDGMERRVGIREEASNGSFVGYRYEYPSSHEVTAEDIANAYNDFVNTNKSFSKGFTKLRIYPDRMGQHVMVPINLSSTTIVKNLRAPFLPGGAIQNVKQGVLQTPASSDDDGHFQEFLRMALYALGFTAPLVAIRGSLQAEYLEREIQGPKHSRAHRDRLNRAVLALTIVVTATILGWDVYKGTIGFGSRFEVVHGISITLGKSQKEFRMRESDRFASGTPFVISAWLRMRQLKEHNIAYGLPLGLGALVSVSVILAILCEKRLHIRKMAKEESALSLNEHIHDVFGNPELTKEM